MNTLKKSALALAVAAALGAPGIGLADTTLYGSARVSVDYDDIDPAGTDDEDIEDFFENGAWDVYNNASRLGVRGSEDLGGGLSAIYQYEFGVDVTEGGNTNNNRPKWVGLKGGFGSVMLGTQWTPYYNVVGIADVFNSDKFALTSGNLNFLGIHRTDNTVLYMTPEFGGFHAEAAVMMNGLERGINTTTTGFTNPITGVRTPAGTVVNSQLPNTDEDVDAYNVSAIYKNGPLFAGVTWMATEGEQVIDTDFEAAFDPGSREQLGVGLGYAIGPLGLALIYEDGDAISGPTAIGDAESTNIYGIASYAIGNAILRVGYGQLNVEPEVGEDFDIQNIVAGAQYNLSKRSRVWLEYIDRDGDDVLDDRQVVSLGVRHDF